MKSILFLTPLAALLTAVQAQAPLCDSLYTFSSILDVEGVQIELCSCGASTRRRFIYDESGSGIGSICVPSEE
ncbi:hypothetical protein BJY00DRAFT_307684 [Aspergillus carlsbadensis]|nr:hypothetical protein BJY00DRAFT_307684 [Aspergillus carlsbadensis]